MKRTLLILLAFMVCIQSSMAGNLDYAKSLYQKENYSDALPEFQDVFDSSTGETRMDAFLHILRCHLFTGDYEDLASFYNQYKDEAEGSAFEPQIHFVYANYLKVHLEDYNAARDMFESLYNNHPNAEFAGPGSLLKLADIDVTQDKMDDGLLKYNELISTYPECPYVDNALLGKVQAYIKLKDRDRILSTISEMRSKFPENLSTASAGLKTGRYFYSIERNYNQALKEFRKVAKVHNNTYPGLLAKLRMADLVDGARIKNSVSLYRTVLEHSEKLRGKQKHWAQTELGVALYLKKDFDEAKIEFRKVLQSDAPEKFKKKANLHIEAIENPSSLSAAFVNIDAAVRYRRDLHAFDKAYWSFRVYTDAY